MALRITFASDSARLAFESNPDDAKVITKFIVGNIFASRDVQRIESPERQADELHKNIPMVPRAKLVTLFEKLKHDQDAVPEPVFAFGVLNQAHPNSPMFVALWKPMDSELEIQVPDSNRLYDCLVHTTAMKLHKRLGVVRYLTVINSQTEGRHMIYTVGLSFNVLETMVHIEGITRNPYRP